MEQPTFSLCKVRDFDGDCYPYTLSVDNIEIEADKEYYYTLVNIEPIAEYDPEIFCIYINGQWHQAQRIDFSFI